MKHLFNRAHRLPRDGDGIVTAFRDGQVTLRSNRRIEGFTNAVQEIGYQGVRRGDLIVHSMDGFAGAIGVSDSDGKASPVVHAYIARAGIDARFFAYLLRHLADAGFVAALAKGIRERSTAFDASALGSLLVPTPPSAVQRAIADYLDTETARIDALIAKKRALLDAARERHRVLVTEAMSAHPAVPLKRVVRYAEGPGIMADDFRESGVPLIRVAGVGGREVSLAGCNFLDPTNVALRWGHFALRLGDRLISASATMGTVSVVGPETVGAIPYTGLIAIRPRVPDVDMRYIELFLGSELFVEQINLLKTGAAIQHFGPTHLGTVVIPLPELPLQVEIARGLRASEHRLDALTASLIQQMGLLNEHRQALITAAVTGDLPVPGTAA